jgi:hypothetical protein
MEMVVGCMTVSFVMGSYVSQPMIDPWPFRSVSGE